jgi:glycosyltransferase involved in cell wall biosynthesis
MTPFICHFTDSLEPSGVGVHMLTLAGELIRRYRVGVVCPPTPPGRRLLDQAAAQGCVTLPLEARGDPTAQARLISWLRAHAAAILHCHAGIGWEGHAGVTAARAAGVAGVVRTEHLPYLLTDPGQCAAYQQLLPLIDRLICVSEGALASHAAAGVPAEKLRLVRNGIAVRATPPRSDGGGARTRLGLAATARLVLTVARLTEQKGHRYLLDAAASVVLRRPETVFVLAGDGPLEPALREQARRLGLERYVVFAGRRDDVPDLLAAADLFVLPSLFEGLPLVVLEAMAAGVPVVGTDIGGTREAIDDGRTGRLVAPGDAAALATAIGEALNAPAPVAAWRAAARRRVATEFGAARMARATAALYDEVLTPATPRRPAWAPGATALAPDPIAG